MLHLPAFKKINNPQDLDTFASNYFQCSGFNVNRDYYETNQVFGIHWRGRMIGGFVLGTGNTLRTLEFFVGAEHRDDLYQQVQQYAAPTEMCCFWIDPACRKNTWINFFVWGCVAYALQAYGTSQLIFGTNSVRLAVLYNQASESQILHTDFLNHKRTFVFTGPRKHCLLGVAQILYYKTKRLVKIAGKRAPAAPRLMCQN